MRIPTLILAALLVTGGSPAAKAESPELPPVVLRTFKRMLIRTASLLADQRLTSSVRQMVEDGHLPAVLVCAQAGLRAGEPLPEIPQSKPLRAAHRWIQANLDQPALSNLKGSIDGIRLDQPVVVATVGGATRHDLVEAKIRIYLKAPRGNFSNPKQFLWVLLRRADWEVVDSDLIPSELPSDVEPTWR
jgi:hypothetical protein